MKRKDINMQIERTEDAPVNPVPTPKSSDVKLSLMRRIWGDKSKRHIAISGSLAFISITALLLVVFLPSPEAKIPSSIKDLKQVVTMGKVSATRPPLPSSKPKEPKTEVSPLNGVLYTKTEMSELMKNAPVSVMVNNHVAARPQFNLNQADVVFESVAESGITRLMPVYWSERPNKVGPIRSVRQYHLEFMSPYNPIFIHDGFASADDPRVDAVTNMYQYGIRTIATYGAWRDSSDGRVAPHNEYSSIVTATEYGETRGYNKFEATPNLRKFRKSSPAKASDGKEYAIKFSQRVNNNGLYDTLWKYDFNSNSYIRSSAGVLQIDKASNEPVHTKNLIIIKTDVIPTYNYKGHMIITTIGEGDAIILRDGEVIEGKWKKKDRVSQYELTDSKGNSIELARGQLWFSVIDKTDSTFTAI